MLRFIILVATSAALLASPAMSAPCRDGKGKFVKCATAPAKPMRCKAANGKFAKCGSPGAKPM